MSGAGQDVFRETGYGLLFGALAEKEEKAMAAEELLRSTQRENDRLREGLRRLKNQDYDSGYDAESYAAAILSGHEPSGEASI